MTLEDLTVLRHYIDEQDTTIYADAFLVDVIERNDGDLNAAASEVWGMKAARFSKLVDVTESGSSRKLSDKAKNAASMAAYYKGLGVDVVTVQSAQTHTRPIIRSTVARPTG
jgi:hypothetical protein